MAHHLHKRAHVSVQSTELKEIEIKYDTASDLKQDYVHPLQAIFAPLVNNPLLSDVTFVVNGELFYAHRVILAAWSRVFRIMFTNGMLETTTNEIPLTDLEPQALMMLLQYMYTGNVELTLEWSLHLLALANRYEVIPLIELCTDYITEKMNVHNCCSFLTAADQYNLNELRDNIIVYVVNHFERVVKTEGFLSLSASSLQHILKSNDIVVSTEERVFEHVVRWLQANLERKHELAQLVPHIRFPLMSSQFLFNVVEKNEHVMSCPAIRELLLEAYRYHAISNLVDPECEAHGPLIEPNASFRFKERGQELVIFGGASGHFYSCSPSISHNHPLSNLRRKNDKYWLPAQAEHAQIGIMFDEIYRLTALRFQNRHSRDFQVHVRRAEQDPWQELIPRTSSGEHKCIKEFIFNKKHGYPEAITAGYMMITLFGRSNSNYHTSIYWLEVMGKPTSIASVM